MYTHVQFETSKCTWYIQILLDESLSTNVCMEFRQECRQTDAHFPFTHAQHCAIGIYGSLLWPVPCLLSLSLCTFILCSTVNCALATHTKC